MTLKTIDQFPFERYGKQLAAASANNCRLSGPGAAVPQIFARSGCYKE